MEGRYEEATVLANQYLALGVRFGDRNAIHSYGAQTLMTSFDLGGIEVHEPLLRDLVASFPSMIGWRSALALYLTEVGRLGEARREFYRVVSDGGLERARPNEWYAAYGGLAVACGEVGDQAIAERLYKMVLPHEARLLVVGYGSYCAGSMQRPLGVLTSVMQQWDLARTHFEEAISRNRAIGAGACNARVHFDYARMLRASGDPAGAARQAALAREIALELGMARLIARVKPYLRDGR
jgi:tetratricopeptide (TPR) repeat protein